MTPGATSSLFAFRELGRRLDDLAADRQARAGAAGAILGPAGLDEGLEDPRQLRRRDARALVSHDEVEFVAGVDLRDQFDWKVPTVLWILGTSSRSLTTLSMPWPSAWMPASRRRPRARPGDQRLEPPGGHRQAQGGQSGEDEQAGARRQAREPGGRAQGRQRGQRCEAQPPAHRQRLPQRASAHQAGVRDQSLVEAKVARLALATARVQRPGGGDLVPDESRTFVGSSCRTRPRPFGTAAARRRQIAPKRHQPPRVK